MAAMGVFPDSPVLGMSSSPRISFSHDLSQSDTVGSVPVAEHYIRSPAAAAIDFDFCVFRDYETSSADELFLDGKILPIQIKKRLPPLRRSIDEAQAPPSNSSNNDNSINKSGGGSRRSLEEEKPPKSFWPFRRSSSLNCGGGHSRSLCPLPLLSRSFSTGSTASGKRGKQNTSNILKHHPKQQAQPPRKKNSHHSHSPNSYYGAGVKFSPVLNVPPANLFGLASIFSGRSNKKN